MDLNEHKEFIGNMQKHISKLQKLQDEAFAKMPPEAYEKIKQAHADSHEMIRKMRKRDFSGVQDLLDKYNTKKHR